MIRNIIDRLVIGFLYLNMYIGLIFLPISILFRAITGIDLLEKHVELLKKLINKYLE